MNVPTDPINARPRDPARVKACCADAYSHDAVALLLGDSYHPGGLTLTRRLAARLDLRPGHHALDIACGPGTSARLMAAERGATIAGIDLADAVLDRARAATAAADLTDSVRFHLGDAESIPFPDNTFDAAVCECALCLFPDKPRAVAEIVRVLRPGGRLGLTDIAIAPTGLPPDLTDLAAQVACIADARPVAAYLDLLTASGLRVTTREDHPWAVAEMIGHIDARLTLLRALAPDRLAGLDHAKAATYLDAARRAVANGLISYTLLIAEKPTAPAEGLPSR